MKSIIAKIKEKPEFRGLSDEFIAEIIRRNFKKLNTANLTSKSEKIVVKEIRAILRKSVGQYESLNNKKRLSLLKENKIDDLLKSHSSTSERLFIYPLLKKRILSLKPKSILDLGCGLNPLAIASKEIFYYAGDINKDLLKIVEEYFRINNIRGKTLYVDLMREEPLPKADVCLIFKVLDLLGKERREITRKLLKSLIAKYIIVSFSTKKLSGKKMSFPRRRWFERILEDSYKFNVLESDNEIFYFIEKF